MHSPVFFFQFFFLLLFCNSVSCSRTLVHKSMIKQMTFCVTESTTPELQTQNNVNTLSQGRAIILPEGQRWVLDLDEPASQLVQEAVLQVGYFYVSVFSCLFAFNRGKTKAFPFIYNKLNLDFSHSESRITQGFYVSHCLIHILSLLAGSFLVALWVRRHYVTELYRY